jgi:hypothetical protein
MKYLKALATLFLLTHCTACGLTPVVQSPCPGLWCFEVAEIKGPKFCYDTAAEMQAAKAVYENHGLTATEIK